MHDLSNEPVLPRKADGSDAVRYVRALVRWVGPGFHPDEDFHNYVNAETGRHSFGIEQATRLNSELARAIDLLDSVDVEVYGVAIRVQHRLLREMGLRAEFSGQTERARTRSSSG